MKKLFKSSALVSLVLLSGSAFAKDYCTSNRSLISTNITPYFTAAEKDIQLALRDFDMVTSGNLKFQKSAIINAINTLTAQKALGAKEVSAALEKNSQVQAASDQAIDTAKRVKKAYSDYGVKGTGHKICQVMASRNDIVIAKGKTEKAIPVMIDSEVTAKPGRYANRSEAMAQRLALHDKLYCTDGQAKSGLCSSTGSRAAKSLMASTLFKPTQFDTDDYRDKSAFINNMMGLPDDALNQNLAATEQGQSYADLKRRKDAIKSTALVSLKNIQADWSGVTSNHDNAQKTPIASSEKQQLAQAGKENANNKVSTADPNGTSDLAGSGLPLSVLMKRDVDRYLGGGQEYKDWSKTLVSANERGVLKEILQIKALRLFMQSQQYKQLARMEGMLAANVSAETFRTGMETNIEKQRQKVLKTNWAGAIRQANR